MMKRILASLCLLALVLLSPLSPPARAEETARLRVLLKSLAGAKELNITLAGTYAVDGDALFRFDRDTDITVSAYGDALLMKAGGLTLGMSDSFTLTRHACEGENGLYILGSQRDGLYLGDLRLSNVDGAVRAILYIDIEEYLYGVVPYEMSDSFPIEALKAQAVAARTYALKRRADSAAREYDLVDTTADQVFMGYNGSYANAIAAVDATKGVAGTYNGEYASCFYTASNGGQTALADVLGVSGDYGYLEIRDDPYDVENPSSVVRALTVRADCEGIDKDLEAMLIGGVSEQLASLGYSDEAADIALTSITAMEPHTPELNDSYRMYKYLRVTVTARARKLEPVYSRVSVAEKIYAMWENREPKREIVGWEPGETSDVAEPLTCDLTVFSQLKHVLGLKVSNLDCELTSVAFDGESYSIELRRYGHGVGMSQRGAQWMAGNYAKTCEEILAFYYPGLAFEAREYAPAELSALPELGAAASAQAAASTPSPTPTPAPLPALGEGEYYARVTLSSAGSTLNVRRQPSTTAPIIDALANGTRVIVASEADGWAYIKTASLAGYVSSAYIAKE